MVTSVSELLLANQHFSAYPLLLYKQKVNVKLQGTLSFVFSYTIHNLTQVRHRWSLTGKIRAK